MSDETKVRIQVDKSRLSMLSVGDLMDAEEGKSFRALVHVVSVFVVDDAGRFVDKAEGLRQLRGLDIEELTAIIPHVMSGLNESAVPKP